MDKQKIEVTVSEIFMDKMAELKQGKELDMSFYLFFSDGYWKFPETDLPKEGVYAIVNLVVNALQPDAYCLISDTNVRDPETMKIMYEQLFACIVEKDGVGMSMFKPYERLPNGKIKLTQPQRSMEGVVMSGRATEMYDPVPHVFPDLQSKSMFVEMHKNMIAKDKIPYQDYSMTAAEKSEADTKGKSRHASEDGPGLN
jgi:hypothetical protein